MTLLTLFARISCVQHNIFILATWIPRDENEFADYYSKHTDSGDFIPTFSNALTSNMALSVLTFLLPTIIINWCPFTACTYALEQPVLMLSITNGMVLNSVGATPHSNSLAGRGSTA